MGEAGAVVRVDVAYVLVEDGRGRVLVVRNRDTWSLPGGRREEGESFAEAAVREAREETGVTVAVGGVVNVSERQGVVHDVFVVFRGAISAGRPQVPVGDEDVSEVRWVSWAEADRLMPWYPDGVRAMARLPGVPYFTS